MRVPGTGAGTRIANQPYPYLVILLCNWVLHSFPAEGDDLKPAAQDVPSATGDGNDELFEDPRNHFIVLHQEPKQGSKKQPDPRVECKFCIKAHCNTESI
jgi:hypothetical protein